MNPLAFSSAWGMATKGRLRQEITLPGGPRHRTFASPNRMNTKNKIDEENLRLVRRAIIIAGFWKGPATFETLCVV